MQGRGPRRTSPCWLIIVRGADAKSRRPAAPLLPALAAPLLPVAPAGSPLEIKQEPYRTAAFALPLPYGGDSLQLCRRLVPMCLDALCNPRTPCEMKQKQHPGVHAACCPARRVTFLHRGDWEANGDSLEQRTDARHRGTHTQSRWRTLGAVARACRVGPLLHCRCARRAVGNTSLRRVWSKRHHGGQLELEASALHLHMIDRSFEHATTPPSSPGQRHSILLFPADTHSVPADRPRCSWSGGRHGPPGGPHRRHRPLSRQEEAGHCT